MSHVYKARRTKRPLTYCPWTLTPGLYPKQQRVIDPMMCSLGFLSCLGDVEKRAPPAVGPLAHLRRRSTRPSPVVMADRGSTSDRLPVNITLQRYLQSYKFSSLTRNSFLHRNKLLLLILAFLFSCSHQFYQPQSILPCKTFLFLGCFLRQY